MNDLCARVVVDLRFSYSVTHSAMAQGKTVLAKKTGSGGRGNAGNLKKGRRVIAPKSRVEINHKVMQKVNTSTGGM